MGSDFLADVCKEWEAEAGKAKQAGTRVVYLRTGLPLAADGGALKAMLMPFKLGIGGPLGSGQQYWPWIHVDDLTGIMLHAITSSLEGPVIGAAPEPVRQKDLAKTLGKVLHRPSFMPAPGFALRLALAEVSSELLASRRARPNRALETGYRFQHLNLAEALRSLV